MDELANEWGDSVQVITINVHDSSAKPVLTALNFRFTPTFVFFDAQGQEIWRSVGSIDLMEVQQQIHDAT